MRIESTKTLYLTKAEKKILKDFYWNLNEDEVDADEIYYILKALAEDTPEYAPCAIKIID